MDVFEMVVIVVALSVFAGLARTWIKQPRWAPPDPQQEARFARLEERVKALEAVVTDHGFDLKRELRALERG